ncbi:LOW QUALITY PROTEIN: uncharacterized protein ACR2FA_004684 [Aphomia sociella]
MKILSGRESSIPRESSVSRDSRVEKESSVPKKSSRQRECSLTRESSVPKEYKVQRESSIPRESKVPKEYKVQRESSIPRESKVPKESSVQKESSKQTASNASIVTSAKESRKVKKSSESMEIKDHFNSKEFTDFKELRDKNKSTNDPWEIQVPSTAKQSSILKDIKESVVLRGIKDPSESKEIKESSLREMEEVSLPRKCKESYVPKEIIDPNTLREFKEPQIQREYKESIKNKDIKNKLDAKESKKTKETKTKSHSNWYQPEEASKDDVIKSDNKPLVSCKEDASDDTAVSVKLSTKKSGSQIKAKEWRDHDIKTEDQAWDMLFTEAQNPTIVNISRQAVESDKNSEESKPKNKRNRKIKKVQDDLPTSVGEDSFVEIHAIDDKQQSSSGELVSISTPYEDVESSSFYLPKSSKSRVSKSSTPERNDISEKVSEIVKEEPIKISDKTKSQLRNDNFSGLEALSDFSILKAKESSKDKLEYVAKDLTAFERTVFPIKESPKSKKSKSLSPYTETIKSTDRITESETKDVYVIDTTKDDFPEIQITRGKSRKKSPQPVEIKSLEPVVPVKSWSSIAASKSNKKVEDVEKKVEVEKELKAVSLRDELRDAACILDDNIESSKDISLQEKLFELCKRTDIMVAECDAPSELNFVDEHHGVLHDLPPLEALDFGLDDFKLEVMQDSLLDVHEAKLTSPICKINIDDILSSIKETTSKVIESSTFNLIDLEKVPAKKEKGFSVVESHKITTQEVVIDDEPKSDEKDIEIMEKSSDDDAASPVASTDSDKDDKKGAGTSKIILPSSKQFKSKKSRRKKK